MAGSSTQQQQGPGEGAGVKRPRTLDPQSASTAVATTPLAGKEGTAATAAAAAKPPQPEILNRRDLEVVVVVVVAACLPACLLAWATLRALCWAH